MRMVKRQILLFVLFVLFGASAAFAQGVTTAAMNGTVVDNDGQPMPGAVIIAVHVPTGTQFGTTSRTDGKFNISNMRVGGPYTLKASFIGYKTQIQEGITLSLGQNFTIDFKLAPENIETMTVSVLADRNAVISGSRTGASTNVGVEQIQAFPTVSRSFQDFAKLTPQFDGRSSSAAGRNNRFNNIQIDGTQYNDLFGLGSSGTPGGQAGTTPISLDAIQEFQVVIAPYDVRQGGFTGGGINAITRSGTNNFSGSLYGYFRNQNFMGYSPDDKKAKVTEFSEYQTGLRLGGPIIKDKLFFFANGEFVRRTDPADNLSLTQGGNLGAKDSLASSMQNILLNKYGYNPGSYGSFSTKRPASKFFIRFDYNISDEHKLTFRHNFVDGSDQKTGRSVSTLEFSDRMYQFNTNTNSSVLQLSSTFSNTMSNELIMGYTRIRDTRDPSGSAFPSVLVKTAIPGFTLKAGAEEFSQANQLDQDIFELTDNFSYYTGSHVITFGTHNEFYKFRNLFIRNLYGYYEFNNMTDFQNGNPSRYQLSYSNTANPMEAAKFNAFQLGIYGQDEWSATDNLKVTLGLRVDAPFFPKSPAFNPTIDQVFTKGQGMDIGTDKVPSGKILFSPRLGLNWDVNGDRTTQLRGGVGIFTGRIPYVWISNQYGNTGVEFGRIDLSAGRTPGLPNGFKFNPDPNTQQKTGLTAIQQTEVDLTAGNFKMPQVARLDAAIDHQLPFGLTGTIEGIYSKSVNDISYQDINIVPQAGKFVSGAGDPGRNTYLSGTKGYSAAFTNVILMKNTSLGYQYNLTAQVQGTLPMGLYTNVAYTYTRSKDVNSVISSQAFSQWRFNPIANDPNNPDLATANFEIRNRFLVAFSYSAEFFTNAKSTFTLYYNGQSGLPFSYTYDGDINGDGQTSNDLIYVPKNATDAAEIQVGSISNKAFKADAAMAQALENYINRDNYLKEHRGQIMERNGATVPWSHQVDFRFVQNIPLFAGHGFELSLDVLNLPNLISSKWGWVKSVPNQNDSVIKYLGNDTNGRPVFSFKDKTDPFQNDNLASRWQMQLGARYSF